MKGVFWLSLDFHLGSVAKISQAMPGAQGNFDDDLASQVEAMLHERLWVDRWSCRSIIVVSARPVQRTEFPRPGGGTVDTPA